MKRSPLNRGTKPLARGGRLRQRSTRGTEADAVFQAARAERRDSVGGWCEAESPACPAGAHPGAHAHHVVLRSRGGGHDVTNLRWVCPPAHAWCHDHPAEATQLGLIERNGG